MDYSLLLVQVSQSQAHLREHGEVILISIKVVRRILARLRCLHSDKNVFSFAEEIIHIEIEDFLSNNIRNELRKLLENNKTLKSFAVQGICFLRIDWPYFTCGVLY